MTVAQNPTTKLWYVIAPCGNGYRMPISDGYKTSAEAALQIKRLRGAEIAARQELEGI